MKSKFRTLVSALALSTTVGSVEAQELKYVTNDSIQKSLSSLKKDLDLLKKLKISGYIQSQYQIADSMGQGGYDGGSFAPNTDRRFMIRRGRFKLTYTNHLVEYVLQMNVTERGINTAEVAAKITEPWTKSFSLKVGLFDRPFSYDVQQSSSARETPERSRYHQILLQNERDMGAALIYEPTSKSKLHGLRMIGGFFNGPGIPSNGDYYNPTKPFYNDFDNYKDFIGRINYTKNAYKGRVLYGVGISHYNGAVRQYNNIAYKKIGVNESGNIGWIAMDSTTRLIKGKGAGRIFYGADAQITVKSVIGVTTLRADYMYGSQPGTSSSSTSQAFEIKTATYVRNFLGYSGVLVQRIGKSRHELAARYAVYDPNTDVHGDQIGKKGSLLNVTDLAYTEFGFGYNCYLTDNFKAMLYYNTVTNETSRSLNGYSKDNKDNVLTLRLQLRF